MDIALNVKEKVYKEYYKTNSSTLEFCLNESMIVYYLIVIPIYIYIHTPVIYININIYMHQ